MGNTPNSEDIIAKIVEQDNTYTAIEKHFGYGTAGFRTKGDQLERVCYRVGVLVALRAKLTNLTGVMITASHNQKDDNGVKIIEGNGSMLVQSWEPLAEKLVNAECLKCVLLEVEANKADYGIYNSIFQTNPQARAYFSMDTRDTSPTLT